MVSPRSGSLMLDSAAAARDVSYCTCASTRSTGYSARPRPAHRQSTSGGSSKRKRLKTQKLILVLISWLKVKGGFTPVWVCTTAGHTRTDQLITLIHIQLPDAGSICPGRV